MNQEGNDKKSRNKFLVVILSVLIIAIFILAFLIIFNFLKPEPEKTLNEKKEILETALTNFKEKYPNVTDNDYENVFSSYQNVLNSTENDEEKAELLTEKIYFLIDYDIDSKYKDVALEDANLIENILHDSSSSTNFLNISTKYNLPELYEKYSPIYEERAKESAQGESEKPGKEYVEEDLEENE